MTTARLLFHRCRKTGIVLAADGYDIAFDAPPGVAVPVDELRRCKDEMLALLRGDYLSAAMALVRRVADRGEREALAYLFDERAGICQHHGNMSQGEAERQAYIELARAVEVGDENTTADTLRKSNNSAKSDRESGQSTEKQRDETVYKMGRCAGCGDGVAARPAEH